MTSPGCPLSLPHTLQAEMLSTLPRLRAFAVSLTGNVDRADDLVHDTLVQALTHIDQFEPGTCLRAWLFTILRNRFMTSCRRGRREQEDPNEALAARLAVAPGQHASLDMSALKRALARLPPRQREAVLLVAAGLSYDEAARVSGTVAGTIKSRVGRARAKLAELVGIAGPEDIGADRLTKAVLART